MSANVKFSSAATKAAAKAARRRIARTVLAVCLLAAAPAAIAAPPPPPRPADAGAIERIEAYLNRIKTMQSRFIQVNPDGSAWQGDLYVHRPGKFRFEYDPPVPHLLIANGIWFYHVDRELKETNVLPLIKTPAQFLVQKKVSFSNGLQVTGFQNADGLLHIGMVTRDKPELGEITLTFSDRPLELRKWTIRDAQDNHTQVTLQNTRFGGNLPSNLFSYVEQPDKTSPE